MKNHFLKHLNIIEKVDLYEKENHMRADSQEFN
jgi:hypothetical protein